MRKSVLNIIALLYFVLPFAACEHLEPELFEENTSGAYFDYDYAVDFDRTLNFAEHIVGSPDTVAVSLKVKLLGYLMEESRTLAVKTRAIEGYELPDVTIDEVVFSDKEYEKEVVVKVKRPEVEDVYYGVCIYLDGSGDIGTGISGKEEIELLVTESYEMPAIWYSHVNTCLGAWNKEKHIFLARHTGDDHFYSRLYDEEQMAHVYNSIIGLNVSAVNALLEEQPLEDSIVNLPILKPDDSPAYHEPYFWPQLEKKLGRFESSKLCRLGSELAGTNTQALVNLCNDDSEKKLQTAVDKLHKKVVTEMLGEYNEYAEQGIPLAEYKERCWVEIDNVTSYDVCKPFWWDESNGLGTDTIVEKYFGEYSDYKYRWMLQRMVEADGAENFVAASVLPFVKEGDTYAWDETSFGEKQLAGEARLKECYRVIKAKYDRLPSRVKENIGLIPDVPLD